jgi:hypothetical protein
VHLAPSFAGGAGFVKVEDSGEWLRGTIALSDEAVSGLGLATCGFRCCLEAKRVRDKMIDFRNVKLQEIGGDRLVGIDAKAIFARQRSPRSAGPT